MLSDDLNILRNRRTSLQAKKNNAKLATPPKQAQLSPRRKQVHLVGQTPELSQTTHKQTAFYFTKGLKQLHLMIDGIRLEESASDVMKRSRRKKYTHLSNRGR